MHGLTPGIETNVGYAACAMLLGLLVVSMRHRRMAAKSLQLSYAAPMRPPRPLAAKNKRAVNQATESARRTPLAPDASELRVSTGPEFTPRPRSANQVPPNFEKEAGTVLESPSPRKSDEVKMNSPSFPLESIDPAALAQISTLAMPAVTEALEEIMPHASAAIEVAAMDAQAAQEIAGAANVATADWSAPAEHTPEAVATEPVAALAETLAAQTAPERAVASITEPAGAIKQTEKSSGEDVLSFHGLRQQPFDVTPDPAFLCQTASHREALASIKEGIEHFRGFMMLVAEPGMGKTTLLNRLMEELAESARVVFLFQTQCSSRELLSYILNELEVDHTGMDIVAMHRALNQALLEEMLRGRRFVLVVDEAQNLQEPVLETLRLLSDFETTHSKLIQIVLAGQPKLAETLMTPDLVQFRQRLAVLASLKALNAEETAAYIQHRLRAAGWGADRILFSSDALDQIAESSGGVPRRINTLCFSALLEGFHRGLETIDADVVKEVAAKLNLEAFVPRPAAAVETPAPKAAAPEETITAAELARALASALAAHARSSEAHREAAPAPTPQPKANAVLTGTLTEKVRSQGWSKHHEYRILVTLERDPISGLAVADRYYCASLYVDEAQAAALEVGKPVRLKIEQEAQ